MTMRHAGEMDRGRTGDNRRGTGRDVKQDEVGGKRSDTGCIALGGVQEGKGLNDKRESLGGSKVIYENIVVIGRVSPAIACLSNVP